MKATEYENEDRQLNKGYLTMVSAEQKEQSEASTHMRIAENNNFIVYFQNDKIIANLGYTPTTSYYLNIHEN